MLHFLMGQESGTQKMELGRTSEHRLNNHNAMESSCTRGYSGLSALAIRSSHEFVLPIYVWG